MGKRQQEPKRSITVVHKAGSSVADFDLPLSRFVVIDIPKKMLNLEELPDGTFRLVCSKNLIDDMTEVVAFAINRHESEENKNG